MIHDFRYYRAPEVIFGLPYGREIDLWSFACVIVELYIGRPLFPGQNEQDQVSLISEIIGSPKLEYVRNLPRRKYFFNDKNELKPYYNEFGKRRIFGSRNFQTLLNTSNKYFIDFLEKCLTWEQNERLTPIDALSHSWIIQGLPQEIRVQHVKYLEKEKQIRNQSEQRINRIKQNSLNQTKPLQELKVVSRDNSLLTELLSSMKPKNKNNEKSHSQENKNNNFSQENKKTNFSYSLYGCLSVKNSEDRRKNIKFQF